MVTESYNIAKGLSGRKLDSSLTVGILVFLYLLIMAYVGLLYEITWLSGAVPAEIYFGGYRYITADMFATVLSFIFIVMFIVEIYWLHYQSDKFFSSVTNSILFVNDVDGRKIYIAYFLKRCRDLLILNIICVLPLFLLFALRDGAWPFALFKNIYILFYASILLLILFDLFHFLTRRSTGASVLTLLALIIFPLVSFMLRPLIEEKYPDSAGTELLQLLPDVFSIGYQYLLYSFHSVYSMSKIWYPFIFMVLGLLTLYILSKRMLSRFAS